MNDSILSELLKEFGAYLLKNPIRNIILLVLGIIILVQLFFLSELLPATQKLVFVTDKECTAILSTEGLSRYYDNLPLKWSKDIHSCIGKKATDENITSVTLIDKTDIWQKRLIEKNLVMTNQSITNMSNFSIWIYGKFLKN